MELEVTAGAEIPAITVTPLLGWSLIRCKCDVLKLFKPAQSAVLIGLWGNPHMGLRAIMGKMTSAWEILKYWPCIYNPRKKMDAWWGFQCWWRTNSIYCCFFPSWLFWGSHVRDHSEGVSTIPAHCNYSWIRTGTLHEIQIKLQVRRCAVLSCPL